jgi:3'-phosphoadenosine 5'-phosphosulfate sulfotransferase (PAPS reductase)/FAD synthetase
MHARTRQFAHKLNRTRDIIAEALSVMHSPYVAFSAGKDSSVVLHLVRSLASDVPAVWGDDEWNLPETYELVQATPHCYRIAARVWHAAWFTSWDTDEPKLPEGTVWVDAPRNDGLQTFARQQGYDGVFLGLRADESSMRRKHLRTFGPLFFAKKHNVWQCNPIAWWNLYDVWAYIMTHHVPYNRAYDRLAEIGVPLERQRVGPIAVERVLRLGQLQWLKRGWPELFNQFAMRFPEARTYV